MKHLIVFAALLLATSAGAQNVTKDAAGNFHALPQKTRAVHDSLTTFTYTDLGGIDRPVYRGPKGGMYVILPNEAGGFRKYYLHETPTQK